MVGEFAEAAEVDGAFAEADEVVGEFAEVVGEVAEVVGELAGDLTVGGSPVGEEKGIFPSLATRPCTWCT